MSSLSPSYLNDPLPAPQVMAGTQRTSKKSMGKLATIHDSDDPSLDDTSLGDTSLDDTARCLIEAHGLHSKTLEEQCSVTGSTAVTLGTSASSSSYWFDETDIPQVVKTVRFSLEPPQVEYSPHRISWQLYDHVPREDFWYTSHQTNEMEDYAHEELIRAMNLYSKLSTELWELFQECQKLDIYDTVDQFRLVQRYYAFLTTQEIRGMERYVHPRMRKHRRYHTRSILQLQQQLIEAKVTLSTCSRCNLLRCKSLESSQASNVLARVLAMADDQACAYGQENGE